MVLKCGEFGRRTEKGASDQGETPRAAKEGEGW